MIGLLYILFFLLFGFISSKIVRWTITWAKGKNKNPKLWGILAGLVMFSLVFWDLIPTYAAHRYYCHKDAGFTVYKTLEQWQQENPGVAEKLVSNPKDLPEANYVETVRGDKHYRLPDGARVVAQYDAGGNYQYTDIPDNDRTQSTTWLNQRFRVKYKQEDIIFGMRRYSFQIIDLKVKSVLAAHTNYDTNIHPFSMGTRSFRDYKFWLGFGSCRSNSEQTLEVNKFIENIQSLGEKEL